MSNVNFGVQLTAPRTPDFEVPDQVKEWWETLDEDEQLLASKKIRDPADGLLYFIENFYWVTSVPYESLVSEASEVASEEQASRLRQVRFWPKQREHFEFALRFNLLIIGKVRQWLFTHAAAARLIQSAITNSNWNLAAISLEEGQRARELGDRAVACWNRLPEGLHGIHQDPDCWGTKLRGWTNGSKLHIMATSEYGASGLALNAAVVDEVHLIEMGRLINVQKLIESGIIATLRNNKGWGWFISTSEGPAGWFPERFKRAYREKLQKPKDWGDMGALFVSCWDHPYWQVPGRWQREYEASGKDPHFLRMYPRTVEDMFTADGASIFNTQRVQEALEWIDSGKTPQPVRCSFFDWQFGPTPPPERSDGPAWLYVPVIHGHQYVLFVDPSEGKIKGDFTAICVVDITAWDTPCYLEWKTIEESEIGRMAALVGRYYNMAVVCPETNKFRGVLKEIQRLLYPNIYFTASPSFTPLDISSGRDYGWRTNSDGSTSKSLGIAALKAEVLRGVHNGGLRIYHRRAWEQMLTYVERMEGKSVKVGAPDGGSAKDDLVTATMNAAYIGRENPERFFSEIGKRMQSLTAVDTDSFGKPKGHPSVSNYFDYDEKPEKHPDLFSDVDKLLRSFQ